MDQDSRILLILDLDETLISATEEPPQRGHEFTVGPYAIARRPYLAEFLSACSACFRLAIWSAATDEYVRAVVVRIMPSEIEPAFVWGRSRCVRCSDSESFEDDYVKDLKEVRRLGYRLERVLIVDDTPRRVRWHYGNAIYVPPFVGDPEDEFLPRLASYLNTLRDVADVRCRERRGWPRTVR
jgi:RNA polymerase II subunit A small phosphatase-like protein